MALKKQTAKPRRGIFGRVLLWGVISVLSPVAISAVTLAVAFWVYGGDPNLPRIHALKDYAPKQSTRILSADGKMVGELYEERRTFVTIDKIAPVMVQAAIDAEDAGFRSHGGISVWGMARAAYVNLRSGRAKQGASTITQQLVKTFLLTPEKTLKRKLQEILLARRLEQALTKDEIITLYLNQIYFGHGRYGIEEAAKFFFAKSAAQLDVGEAALLAGLPQSPERLSPFKHPEAAKLRQIYVLNQLVENGHLDAKAAQKLIDDPIRVVRNPEPHLNLAPEWLEVVKQALEERYGKGVSTAGYVVETTLDVGMQQAARAALEAGLRAVDERHGYRGPVARLKPADVPGKLKALRKALPDKGPRLGETYDAVVTQVSDDKSEMLVDLGGWIGAVPLEVGAERLNPGKKKPSERFAASDLVRVRLAPELRAPRLEGARQPVALELGPQGAMVVIDPATREVRAMVGGYDFGAGGFNRALRAKRQPGSAFKPFVYAAALDGGQYTPASIVNDAPEVYDLWKPKNYEKGKFRGPVRLREALAHSINTVAIRLIADVTPARAAQLARDMGIKEDLPEELSLALGSGVATPIEMTNAYASFAAGGKVRPPVLIKSINGVPEKTVEEVQVLRPEVAFLTTSLMTSVVNEGTATPAKKLKREIAGKTGTSNSGKDAWFVGYTADLVAGVWIGYDDMRAIGKGETGGKATVPIFVDFMKTALKGRNAVTFTQPPGVVVARIDRRTGLLAAPDATEAETLNELFLDGTAPTETAPSAGEVDPSTFVLEAQDDEQSQTSEN